jgi:hypothetical protein
MRCAVSRCLQAGVLWLAAGSAQAAVCTVQDSPDVCRAKVLARLEQGAAPDLGKINTGPSAATTALPTSAYTDFFSLLNVGMRADQAGDVDDQALGFEWNSCSLISMRAPLQCQVRVRLADSEVFEPLQDAIPEVTRATRVAELSDSLDQADNVAAGVFFNLVSESYGRVPRFGEGTVFAAIASQVDAELRKDRTLSNEAAFAWATFLETLPEDFQRRVSDNPQLAFIEYPDGAGGRTAAATYEETIAPRLMAATARNTLLQRYGYFDLIDLVNNQPQLHAGIEVLQRDELVGPDELRAKITYEIGSVNMNDLRRRCLAATNQAGVGDCTARFLADKRALLEASNRLAVTLEYVERKRYFVSLPQDGVTLDLPKERSLIGSLVFGGYFKFVSDDPRSTRFDLAASYEDVSNDPLRRNRGIGTLTLSQVLSSGLIASATIVYATEPEYRDAVQKEWSSRIGINYKFGVPAGTWR